MEADFGDGDYEIRKIDIDILGKPLATVENENA